MKKSVINYALLLAAVMVVAFAVWGPEKITVYKDRTVLNSIHTQTTEMEEEGYRYQLSSGERLYILSRCLNSQTLPESEQNALTRTEEEMEYQESDGTYAFVINRQGPSGREITDEEIYSTCNQMLEEMKSRGILPDTLREVTSGGYDAVLYSAIDVLEPRNNVSVWKVSLSTNQKNADKSNRLIDAYVDADTGKLYEFYARTQLSWEEIDPDEIINSWGDYMGLGDAEEYETDNPLLETTPYYKKYVFKGNGEERTIVTIGFYEGINELFLKISR
ncbi:MAG: hypothetical protein HDR20_04650 [Lachnospiraceae bacterium]|nr:hypothetical protein [Lachnospiraceae bacterium]